MEKKILYLWDLTGTLFHEKWNKEFTGVDSYEDWLEEKLNKNIKDVSPREYEEMCREPYSKGKHFNLDIYPGFKEVLEWTKNNEAFTSGLIEHNDWRAKYLNPILGYDIRQYFQKINTTFDYEDTNIKNEEMFYQYLQNKYKQGYKTIIYTEDKIKYIKCFKIAALKLHKKYPDFSFRLYHILHNEKDIKDQAGYWEAGSLLGVLNNEKKLSV
ncbi:MAG: hypothetical protein HOE19_04455 [Candidatus Komeilibacteria bacterium]|jgi:hypothetical protein|nr:hypothetical protein [Candidatus Komeilibacteria bacterium]MBT4447925.1 hypothetical protein [Candidatus Komeilibacteria bacterium]